MDWFRQQLFSHQEVVQPPAFVCCPRVEAVAVVGIGHHTRVLSPEGVHQASMAQNLLIKRVTLFLQRKRPRCTAEASSSCSNICCAIRSLATAVLHAVGSSLSMDDPQPTMMSVQCDEHSKRHMSGVGV